MPGLEPNRPETEIQQKGHIFDALPGSGREARSVKEFTFLVLLPGLELARPETEIQQKGHIFDALPGSVDLSILYINMYMYNRYIIILLIYICIYIYIDIDIDVDISYNIIYTSKEIQETGLTFSTLAARFS